MQDSTTAQPDNQLDHAVRRDNAPIKGYKTKFDNMMSHPVLFANG